MTLVLNVTNDTTLQSNCRVTLGIIVSVVLWSVRDTGLDWMCRSYTVRKQRVTVISAVKVRLRNLEGRSPVRYYHQLLVPVIVRYR